MKQKIMKGPNGVETLVAEISVKDMEAVGFKVIGDGPDQVQAVAEAPAAPTLPAMFRTKEFFAAAMNALPKEGDADMVIRDLRANFGDLVNQEAEDFVRANVKGLDEDNDKGDNTDVDPKYHDMPVKQLKELLDAKGLDYDARASKGKLVEILIASGKPKT